MPNITKLETGNVEAVFLDAIWQVKVFDRHVTTPKTSVENIHMFTFRTIKILMKMCLRLRYCYTASTNFPAVCTLSYATGMDPRYNSMTYRRQST